MTRTKRELEIENEELRSKLEQVYDSIGEFLAEDEDDESGEAEEDEEN